MRKIFSLLAIIVVIISSFTFSSHAQNPKSNVNIIFDGKNAMVGIIVNHTQQFYLKFTHLYISDNSNPTHMKNLRGLNIGNMNIKKNRGYNNVMGNYTQITMWKSVNIRGAHGRYGDSKITLTLNFYIAERAYKKGEFIVNRSTIRYDTKIETNIKTAYVFLEEHMQYKDAKMHGSRVFEQNSGKRWKDMERSQEVREHRFGMNRKGMIGFGKNNVSFRYMWDYDTNIKTFYKYDENQLTLFFMFQNNNGSILQDPYIYLPLPVSNSNPVVEGVVHIVNYTIEHALSLGIGILIASVIIFSVPLIKKFRL